MCYMTGRGKHHHLLGIICKELDIAIPSEHVLSIMAYAYTTDVLIAHIIYVSKYDGLYVNTKNVPSRWWHHCTVA